MMIFYEATCRYCKKTFRASEGTTKYNQLKRNVKAPLSCDDCDRRIEADARKYLFDRE